MDTWLKTLVAAACVVVIAGGGLYIFGQYNQAKRQDAITAARESARSELFELASATPEESEKVRRWCSYTQARTEGETRGDEVQRILTNCRSLGFL